VVDDEALGDVRQQRARLAAQRSELPADQDTHEGVLCQVGRIAAVAQLLAQPRVQPAVMVAVERMEFRGKG